MTLVLLYFDFCIAKYLYDFTVCGDLLFLHICHTSTLQIIKDILMIKNYHSNQNKHKMQILNDSFNF